MDPALIFILKNLPAEFKTDPAKALVDLRKVVAALDALPAWMFPLIAPFVPERYRPLLTDQHIATLLKLLTADLEILDADPAFLSAVLKVMES